MEDLGIHLRRIRLQKGLSQERVAFDAGITVGTYGSIERGRHPRGDAVNPTLDTLFRIFEALDATYANISGDPLGFKNSGPDESPRE